MNPVLASVVPVVERSKSVRIDESCLERQCQSARIAKTDWHASAPFAFRRLDDEGEIAFTLVFNAVNYSYWADAGETKWAIAHQGETLDGAWGMMAALRRALEEGRPITRAAYLAGLNDDEARAIFRGNVTIPLFEERLCALQGIGRAVGRKYRGSFSAVVAAADADATRLLKLLPIEFPSYDDRARYDGRIVQFQKRAQLAVSDIHERLRADGKEGLRNIGELTAFADYKLPQVLRHLGILKYAPALAAKVDGRIELAPGCPEEVEIRANTVWAVELMRRIIPAVSAVDIDHHLWIAGQGIKTKPYHLTRTTAY